MNYLQDAHNWRTLAIMPPTPPYVIRSIWASPHFRQGVRAPSSLYHTQCAVLRDHDAGATGYDQETREVAFCLSMSIVRKSPRGRAGSPCEPVAGSCLMDLEPWGHNAFESEVSVTTHAHTGRSETGHTAGNRRSQSHRLPRKQRQRGYQIASALIGGKEGTGTCATDTRLEMRGHGNRGGLARGERSS